MAKKTYAELSAEAQVIVAETAAGGNTKTRVGGLFQDIVDSLVSLTTRVQATASAATLTPDVDNYDMAEITAQAEALAIANPTGTPSDGNGFVFRIKDNGTARAISFGALYRGVGGALPTITTLGKVMYFAMAWNSADSKWDVFPSQVEP